MTLPELECCHSFVFFPPWATEITLGKGHDSWSAFIRSNWLSTPSRICFEKKRISETQGSFWKLGALPSLLPCVLGSTPNPTVLCRNELLPRGLVLGRAFKGNRQNTQSFRVRAEIYRQNAAIRRLFNKDIQPEQKATVSPSLRKPVKFIFCKLL